MVKSEATSGTYIASEVDDNAVIKQVWWLYFRIFSLKTEKERSSIKMVKKTGTSKLASGAEELIAVNNANGNSAQTEGRPIPVAHPQMQEKVNLVIHEWLTDMWLLTTGEELEELESSKKHNGRPLAVVCDGQMKLMESKVCTLDALRTVGIEMS